MMDKKYIKKELEQMNWQDMILVIKIIPAFTFLFPYSILNIKKVEKFADYIIDFMLFMEKENIRSFDMGPFRIQLNFDQKKSIDDPKLSVIESDHNVFSLTFIVDEYIKNKWDYAYSQNKLNEYQIIKKFTLHKGYKETAEEIERVIRDGSKFSNN